MKVDTLHKGYTENDDDNDNNNNNNNNSKFMIGHFDDFYMIIFVTVGL
jgi:hypothetical protein